MVILWSKCINYSVNLLNFSYYIFQKINIRTSVNLLNSPYYMYFPVSSGF